MIGKFGLKLDSDSKAINVFGIENLYYFLTSKLPLDYFRLLEKKKAIEKVISNELKSCQIITDDYGYFKIDATKAVLIWENCYEEDLPDLMIRGQLPTTDVLEIISDIINDIENNNWSSHRIKLKSLFDNILDFHFEEYQLSIRKGEKSFAGDCSFKCV